MTTWGPRARKQRPAGRKRTTGSGDNAPAQASRAPARAGRSKSARARASSDETNEMDSDVTGPARRPRDRAGAELREAVTGRENEFVGFALLAVAVLLGLAIYFGLAGPVGRGVEIVFGWLTGIGRFVVPVALGTVGVAFIRRERSAQPFRLSIGWALVALAVLGMLHLIAGPAKISATFDEFEGAGGWAGALVAEPLRAALALAGAVVVLLAGGMGGVLLITSTSLRTAASHTGRVVTTMARPLGHFARRTMDDLSSLNSDREGDDLDEDEDEDEDEDAGAAVGTATIPGQPGLPSPQVYDAAHELDSPWDQGRSSELAPPGAARGSAATVGDDEVEGAASGGESPWRLPPKSSLETTGRKTFDKKEATARGETLHEALAQHGVETSLAGMTIGPTVTRYELELGAGVKVARVTNLQKDIAYAMAATDVRILAPIPGRSAIGVEVPNHTRQPVVLGDLLAAPEAEQATHPLEVAIGMDIAGHAIFLHLATTPHLLIAGATGAGKSSGLNCILTSLLMRSTPDDVRLILIDPKQVEMGQYNRLPHLLTQPVTDPKKAANALAWTVKEMERRYDILSEVGTRDVAGYNKLYDRGELPERPGSEEPHERLPYIVVVVDELNDLMMVAARDVEESITRIAQKARAVGIHLIVATQRPSVNVITGVIKANIPARMAFTVSSLTDSRVILDQPGAEKLVGKGDMLLLPGNSSIPQRVQGSWVTEDEIRGVVAHWRRQAPEVSYVSGVGETTSGGGGDDSVTASSNAAALGTGSDEEDEESALVRQAMELVVRSQLGSTSMLQRKLKVGFARAGRVMDLLEQRGVVGPSEGSKAREVLMTVEELELLEQAEGG